MACLEFVPKCLSSPITDQREQQCFTEEPHPAASVQRASSNPVNYPTSESLLIYASQKVPYLPPDSILTPWLIPHILVLTPEFQID
jgi:hypothetical protein